MMLCAFFFCFGMDGSKTMELSTTSRGESTGHEVELDMANQQGPFHDAIIVIFNLDMTADFKAPYMEICQIAACCNSKTFNVYIMPSIASISLAATAVHGIKIRHNKLYQNNLEVPALSPKEGLTKFLEFLSDQTSQTRKVLLAAHNCSSFHRHRLVSEMKQYKLLDSFQSLVLGTIDTLQVFKTTLNSPVKENKKFDLETLAGDYLQGKAVLERQRNATVNVDILTSLIEAIGCTDAILKQHAKDLDVFLRAIHLQQDLKDVVTPNMINKIAEAGITFDVLKNEYSSNGGEGVSKFLQEKVDGKVRVTKNKEIIEKINAKLSKLLDIDYGNGN